MCLHVPVCVHFTRCKWAVELVSQTLHLCYSLSCMTWHVAPLHGVNLECWCIVCPASDLGPAQPRPLNPLTVMYLASFLSPLFLSCRFPLTVPPQPFPFCSSCTLPLLLLFTSSSPLHPLFAPLCPTAVSVTGALDSVVVSALWHNLRLLGGAGPPVALQGRHSVPTHYRHNLLLSPVSKPRQPPQRKTQR